MRPKHTAPPEWVRESAALSASLANPLALDMSGFSVPEGEAKDVAGILRESAAGAGATLTKRWALYRKQRWVRLFETYQLTARRTAMALGYFEFNQIAHEYLLRSPPSHWDLGHATHGFLPWLVDAWMPAHPETLARRGIPREALHECVLLDLAESRAFQAKPTAPWLPTIDELQGASDKILRQNHSATLLALHWGVSGSGGPFRERVSPEYLVVLQRDTRVLIERVDPPFARLLELTRGRPLGAALEAWHAESVSDPSLLQTLMREGVQREYWVGFD
jgi:Putative DNA-binding domain